MFENFLSGGKTKNPYISNKPYFDKYGNEMDVAAQRYNPWINRGNQASESAYNAYQRDVNDPNFIQNKIASGFEMSPYQQYLEDQVTKRLNFNSANTGMLGSGAAQRALMQELTKNTGQFQNEYINRGMNTYDKALGGLNSTAEQALRVMPMQDELMTEAAGGRLKGGMSENETEERNRQANAMRDSNIFGSILGLGTGIIGNMGGIGGIASSIGSLFGGNSGGGGGGYSPSNYRGNSSTNSGYWAY